MSHSASPRRLALTRVRAASALLVLTGLAACHSAPSSDSAAALSLEECDPAQLIPCISPEAFAAVLMHATGLYLTYSGRWANGADAVHPWDVGSLGLGGWSLNAVQRYDTLRHVLYRGDGTWRITPSVLLRNGNRIVPTYDGAQAYVFDAAGRHIRTVDGRLGTTLLTIAYDKSGKLTSVDGTLDSTPVHVLVERGPDGTPRALVGLDSGRSSLELDAHHRLTALSDPAGGRTSAAWDPAGHLTSLTNALGATTTFAYDIDGHLTTVTDPDSVTRRFERSISNDALEIRATSALGRHWTYRVEHAGDALHRTFVDRDGTTTSEVVDAHGVRTVTHPDGTVFTVGSTPSTIWGNAAPLQSPIVERRPDHVTSRRVVVESLHSIGAIPYALTGSVRTVINGQLWQEQVDAATRTVVAVDPLGRRMTTRYDTAGRLASVTAPGRPQMNFAYDSAGRLATVTMGTGTSARVVRRRYDASIGRITTTLPDGSVRSSEVDRSGNVVVNAKGGEATTTTYDAADRLARVQPPGGMTFTLGSSLGGRSTAFAPPVSAHDSSVETRMYDADGALTSVSGLGGHVQSLEYDGSGRMQRLRFGQGVRTFEYDAHSGALAQASDPSGVTTTYSHASGSLVRLAWSGPITGSVDETLDADGRPLVERVNGVSALDFAYDGSGLLTRVGALVIARDPATGAVTRTTLGSVVTADAYNDEGLLARATTTTTAGMPLLDLRYTYDALDRIAGVSTTAANGASTSTVYNYDGAGRLAVVRVNGHEVERDEYDPAGNRTNVQRSRGVTHGTYDDRNETVVFDSARYDWSAVGTLARVQSGARAESYIFDDFDGLRSVQLPDGRAVRYLLDAGGRRVGRSVNGVLRTGYLYSPNGSIAAATDARGTIVARFGYDEAGHVALAQRAGVDYRIVTDPTGSPLLVIDSRSGAIVDAVTYDAWGGVQSETAPGFVPFGFAGALRDMDTGLLRMGARDYDPGIGRWTAPDPMRFAAGDANLYRYVGDDPINQVDPRGLCGGPIGPVGGLGAAGIVFSATYNLVDHFDPCPPTGGNPPNNGSPGDNQQPANPGPNHPWQCNNPTGGCFPGGNPSCSMGNCGGDRHTFHCIAIVCTDPDGTGCIGDFEAGSPCEWNWADPHLRAANGFRFDFQAAGEFTMAQSRDTSIVIQGRQERWLSDAVVTINTGVAARVHGDRVGVYSREPAYLVINDAPVADREFERTLPHGGTIVRHGDMVIVRWKDGSRLTVNNIAGALNYTFAGTVASSPMRGVLSGPTDGAPDALLTREGSVLRQSDPAFPVELYHSFAESWRLGAGESLFHYWPGESANTFHDVRIPARPVTTASLSAPVRAHAASLCRALGVHDPQTLDDCILDVGLTGVPALAASSAPIGARRPLMTIRRASSGTMSPTTTGDTAPTAQRQSNTASMQTTESDEFAIAIGDTVAPDLPARGAGIIKRAGQRQKYTFTGKKGDVIFLAFGPCQGAQPSFDLRTSGGALVTNVIGNCHPIMQREILPVTGTYGITVSTDTADVASRYGFVLYRVPPDEHFTGRLPLTVAPDVPARGAGRITIPGARQMFDFSAAPGAVLHVDAQCARTCEHIAIRVVPIGHEANTLGSEFNFVHTDWTLPAGGHYTVEVRSDGYIGDYSFVASVAHRKAP